MQKIVIDTDIIVSALIQRSYPFHILNEIFSNSEIRICISDELFKEYFDVLNRKKFSKYSNFVSNVQLILTEIERISINYKPKTKVDILSDKDDNKLLELAKESRADFLITGNHTDFNIKQFEKTKIVNPKEYWLEYILR